jgi:hypothetical protein
MECEKTGSIEGLRCINQVYKLAVSDAKMEIPVYKARSV